MGRRDEALADSLVVFWYSFLGSDLEFGTTEEKMHTLMEFMSFWGEVAMAVPAPGNGAMSIT